MKTLENRTGLIFDLFFCVVYMPLLVLLGPVHHWWSQWPLFFIIVCIYMYGCYFVTKHLDLPKLILSKSYYKLAAVAGGFVLCTYLLSLYPLPEMDFVTPSMSRYQTHVRDYEVAISLWFMFSVVICYSLTVAFVKELYERMLLQNRTENERNKAMLEVFKAQISPHFLFNTLNSLYSLVIGTSQKAEDAFIKFTEILKYTYLTADHEQVKISDEIFYIQNYIDLQLIRLNNHTKVEWNWSVDDENTTIPPMIFLTFLENAFKYGASTSHDCSIRINLTLRNGILVFETSNRIMKHADEFRKDVPVGIGNCRNRLNGLFPGRHTLNIEEREGVFNVFLKIELDQNE